MSEIDCGDGGFVEDGGMGVGDVGFVGEINNRDLAARLGAETELNTTGFNRQVLVQGHEDASFSDDHKNTVHVQRNLKRERKRVISNNIKNGRAELEAIYNEERETGITNDGLFVIHLADIAVGRNSAKIEDGKTRGRLVMEQVYEFLKTACEPLYARRVAVTNLPRPRRGQNKRSASARRQFEEKTRGENAYLGPIGFAIWVWCMALNVKVVTSSTLKRAGQLIIKMFARIDNFADSVELNKSLDRDVKRGHINESDKENSREKMVMDYLDKRIHNEVHEYTADLLEGTFISSSAALMPYKEFSDDIKNSESINKIIAACAENIKLSFDDANSRWKGNDLLYRAYCELCFDKHYGEDGFVIDFQQAKIFCIDLFRDFVVDRGFRTQVLHSQHHEAFNRMYETLKRFLDGFEELPLHIENECKQEMESHAAKTSTTSNMSHVRRQQLQSKSFRSGTGRWAEPQEFKTQRLREIQAQDEAQEERKRFEGENDGGPPQVDNPSVLEAIHDDGGDDPCENPTTNMMDYFDVLARFGKHNNLGRGAWNGIGLGHQFDGDRALMASTGTMIKNERDGRVRYTAKCECTSPGLCQRSLQCKRGSETVIYSCPARNNKGHPKPLITQQMFAIKHEQIKVVSRITNNRSSDDPLEQLEKYEFLLLQGDILIFEHTHIPLEMGFILKMYNFAHLSKKKISMDDINGTGQLHPRSPLIVDKMFDFQLRTCAAIVEIVETYLSRYGDYHHIIDELRDAENRINIPETGGCDVLWVIKCVSLSKEDNREVRYLCIKTFADFKHPGKLVPFLTTTVEKEFQDVCKKFMKYAQYIEWHYNRKMAFRSLDGQEVKIGDHTVPTRAQMSQYVNHAFNRFGSTDEWITAVMDLKPAHQVILPGGEAVHRVEREKYACSTVYVPQRRTQNSVADNAWEHNSGNAQVYDVQFNLAKQAATASKAFENMAISSKSGRMVSGRFIEFNQAKHMCKCCNTAHRTNEDIATHRAQLKFIRKFVEIYKNSKRGGPQRTREDIMTTVRLYLGYDDDPRANTREQKFDEDAFNAAYRDLSAQNPSINIEELKQLHMVDDLDKTTPNEQLYIQNAEFKILVDEMYAMFNMMNNEQFDMYAAAFCRLHHVRDHLANRALGLPETYSSADRLARINEVKNIQKAATTLVVRYETRIAELEGQARKFCDDQLDRSDTRVINELKITGSNLAHSERRVKQCARIIDVFDSVEKCNEKIAKMYKIFDVLCGNYVKQGNIEVSRLCGCKLHMQNDEPTIVQETPLEFRQVYEFWAKTLHDEERFPTVAPQWLCNNCHAVLYNRIVRAFKFVRDHIVRTDFSMLVLHVRSNPCKEQIPLAAKFVRGAVNIGMHHNTERQLTSKIWKSIAPVERFRLRDGSIGRGLLCRHNLASRDEARTVCLAPYSGYIPQQLVELIRAQCFNATNAAGSSAVSIQMRKLSKPICENHFFSVIRKLSNECFNGSNTLLNVLVNALGVTFAPTHLSSSLAGDSLTIERQASIIADFLSGDNASIHNFGIAVRCGLRYKDAENLVRQTMHIMDREPRARYMFIRDMQNAMLAKYENPIERSLGVSKVNDEMANIVWGQRGESKITRELQQLANKPRIKPVVCAVDWYREL